MKECPNCRTMLDDDEMFCHECGTKQELEEVAVQNEETATPIETKCIHCGETIEEDSSFCPYCGKPQIVEEVKEIEPEHEDVPKPEEKPEQDTNVEPEQQEGTPQEVNLETGQRLKSEPENSSVEEKTEPIQEVKPESEEIQLQEEKLEQDKELKPKSEEKKGVPEETPEQKEIPVQETANEQNSYESEVTPKSRKWVWILLAALLAGIGGWYYFTQNDSYEDGDEFAADTIVEESELNEDESVDSEETEESARMRAFLDDFYQHYLNEDFLKSHVTPEVLTRLRDDYLDYCDSGDCLGTWVFTACLPNTDWEYEEGPIISETTNKGVYMVDYKYSTTNEGQKTNTVYITVSEENGNYLISDYKVIGYEGRNAPVEQDTFKEVTADEELQEIDE